MIDDRTSGRLSRPQVHARIAGVLYLMIVAAGLFAERACYFCNGLAEIVAPPFASILVLLPAFVGELAFAVWLTVKG